MIEDPLLTPYQLSGLNLRNRIVSTAHSSRYTSGGIPTERYRAYQEQKARGGVGLVTLGGSAVVSRDSPPAFGNITMYKDEVVGALERVVDSCRTYGSGVFLQLTHLGRRTTDHTGDWLPTVSSASLREPAHRAYPKAAEPWDEDRIVADFAAAAERAMAAGVDGIELEHYGHLLDAFASPWHLSRLSPDDRARATQLPERVIRAITDVIGDDMVLGVRMAVDERRADGLDLDAAHSLLRRYVALGIRFVNVVVGTIESATRLSEVIPGAGHKSAPFLDTVAEVKRSHPDVTVLHAAKIDDVATARHAISNGFMDLVGMTRANIADPYLVTKIRERRERDIRPCIGARYCLEGGTTGGVVCVHNPAVGRETHLRHEIDTTARRSRKVVVVGAGPAGLEAAHVAAKRGHEVTVLEAASEAGGQVNLLIANDRRRDLAGAVDWRLEQARKYGVEFRFGVFADETIVLATKPDVVVVATGGLARTPSEAGLHLADQVDDIWTVFEQPHRRYGRVLLYDDDGRYPSLDAVEVLAKAGNTVTYASPERSVGVEVGALNFADFQATFDRHGVTFAIARGLHCVEPHENGATMTATLETEAGAPAERVTCDAVFYAGGTNPNDELYHALRAHSSNEGRVDYDAFIRGDPQPQPHVPDSRFALYRVGDAITSRNMHAAILDAHRLALGV
ncbi:FAD-dependent oxidoreductase [Prauserella rugosa]|uniref:2,4-dienoyl-CoA reductase-like NADH-dependent reductase (Old Yellow Enzyme family) n=1 Tax=Prauserella rugosa TaxID=43354 RepID=A0A660C8J5_9PSEU|nr:FAD-dependent oxidoreductase [Prauserella rugosa]KMS89832.1 hypothetical protein ACZ91_18410 [Streptomyces regensis]TWH18714.1 2,4-dienoyl-CoA reductase-like NADH-dependent reductase (Old Yellow Enzyme family) [Prauserella rugosa]